MPILKPTNSLKKPISWLISPDSKKQQRKESCVQAIPLCRHPDLAQTASPIGSARFAKSSKRELAKMKKRQDDIIRFIRHYEEEQLNPMIRATNSIALRFDAIGKTLEILILSQLEASQERQTAVLKKLSEQFCNHADVINNQSKQINALYQIHQRDYKKLLHLIQLYSELSACGVMDSKRKENLKAEISNLINT